MSARAYFGTDGIRGVANRGPLTPDFVVRLGRAAALTLGAFERRDDQPVAEDRVRGLRVVIGRDTRISGQMLESAFAAGLASAGADVELLGVLPTPAVALHAVRSGSDFAIVISASHNPAGDNGIKFFDGDGFKLSDETESAIERQLDSMDETFGRAAGDAVGRIRFCEDARQAYVEAAVATVPGLELGGMKVVVDAAHGAATGVTAEALRRLGATVIEVGNQPDGRNINAGVGCTHPDYLEGQVREHGADVGIAHDGDADRVLFVDETGSALDGDELLAIAGRHMAAEEKLAGSTLVATVMSNFGLETALAEVKCRVERADVGDRYVIEAMRRGDYALGGEQSGHIIFRDFTTTGDGLIAALQVLAILRESGKRLSVLRTCLCKLPQAQKAVPVASKPAIESVPELCEAIQAAEEELAESGRVFLRYSGTESVLRILLEGPDAERLQALCDGLERTVREAIG